jgi:hypothetical protein
MRKLKLGAMIVAAAAMTIGAAGVAAAQDDTEQQETREVDVAGRGSLRAHGTGVVNINMGGYIRVHIDGNLAINNLGDEFDVRIESDANATERLASGPDVVLNDFEGWVVVRGNHFAIHLEGRMTLHAHGRGAANLMGQGIYKTNNGRPHRWDPTGRDLAIEADAA